MSKSNKKGFLIIAAHPDDEILGCGGTAARLINEGWIGSTIILGEGITSRGDKRDPDFVKNDLSDLKIDSINANKEIGIDKVYFENFPDNRFDTVSFLDIVKKIEYFIKKIEPQIIFTHYANDLNMDHSITNRAVLTAARPMKDELVKTIFAFEVMSSTEWNFPLSYSPDTFYNVANTINKKLSAMEQYKNELREYPHPRSLQAIKEYAKVWGIKTGLEYSESFQTLRNII